MAGYSMNYTGVGRPADIIGLTAALALEMAALACKALRWGYRALREQSGPDAAIFFPGAERFIMDAVCTALYSDGYCPSTCVCYGHIAERFLRWEADNCPGRATPQDFLRFLDVAAAEARGQRPPGLAPPLPGFPPFTAQRRTLICAARTVLDRLFGRDLTTGLPMPPRCRPRTQASLDDVQALFENAVTDRERMLLVLSNGLKLRPSQAAELTWESFAEGFGSVFVPRRKGGVQRLPVCSALARVIGACHARRRQSAHVFPGKEDGRALCVRTLQNTLGRLVARSGIDRRLTITALRKADVWAPPRAASLPECGSPADTQLLRAELLPSTAAARLSGRAVRATEPAAAGRQRAVLQSVGPQPGPAVATGVSGSAGDATGTALRRTPPPDRSRRGSG